MPRRGSAPDSARRQSAWTGARSSPTFSSQRPNQNSFPPLTQQNDRLIQTLSGLTGTTVTISLKDGQRFQGKISSTTTEGESAGVTLQEVKDLANINAQAKEQFFIASANIETWSSGPADAKLTNGNSFKTDSDISSKAQTTQRELQPWQPAADATPSAPSSTQFAQGDDVTFGPGANSGADWDQFAANEQLFGVKASFDESAYTTPLDRSGPDFKERERKAQRLANEINGAVSSNPHVAEERNLGLDDSGVNEEDKYGAVVRGTNAYIPPGARKQQQAQPKGAEQKAEVPAVAVNAPDGAAVSTPPSSSKAPSPAPSNTSAKPTADALPAFRDFVTNEKQRLTQRRQALVKSEMDKKMAELVKFSQSFKLNKPIPDDLVPILAKDEDKQKAIVEKASKDASSAQARTIGSSTTSVSNARPPAAVTKPDAVRKPSGPTVPKPTAASNAASPQLPAAVPKNGTPKADGKLPKINMVIQAIPPFKGKTRQSLQPPPRDANGASSSTDSSKSTTPNVNRLNVNASSFRPKSNAFTSSATTSPKPESPKPKDATPAAPNPFFGVRPLKKNLVNIKDDFNPFKSNKVVDPATVLTTWSYNGKRYSQMFPPSQHAPQPHPGHVPQQPPPVPPPPYEDQETRMPAGGYVYYPPYGYPGQMMPVPPPGPPGTFIPAPYMQPMPYPPGMPPNAMYAPPGMGQMPPPQAYMPPPPPPPGTYPPPPGGQAPRPSMPPTPIPAHAHPYYHPSPQLQHAVPYQMMMPPPPNAVPQHPYEGGPAPPVMNHG